MKRHILWLLSLSILAIPFSLQSQRSCGTMDVLEQQKQQNPALIRVMENIEKRTRQYSSSTSRAINGVITIPVVVHVVWNNNAENVSDQQIYDQIDVLNQDFRRLNSNADNTWSQASDTEFEFCLATVDPNGNPTSGITRTQTDKNSFSTNDNVKFDSSGGKDAWPADSYMNMWVCDIKLLFFDVLGYAQFPGGAAATDGVVIDYKAFGVGGSSVAPADLGRTATHEVGHYLNLRHIWGDGGCGVDDFVDDTPTSDNSNYGCKTTHVSCDTQDMVQNYMDYSDDACMSLFTVGQTTRMRALFDTGGFRESLLNSEGCGNPVSSECNPNDFLMAPTGLTESFTGSQLILNWDAYPNSTRCTIQGNKTSAPNNGSFHVGSFNGTVAPTQRTFPLTQLEGGEEYRWRIRCSCEGESVVNSPYSDFRTFIAPPGVQNDGSSFLGEAKAIQNDLDMALFPNPAQDILNITVNGSFPDQVTFEVLDMTGKEVLLEQSVNVKGNSIQLDIADLESGLYMIRAIVEGQQSTQRWIKH